jgi:protoporphyrinogen oxidase
MMLVLGGGVAGLSAAYFSGAPLYDAADTPGGVARSKQISGYTFDYGIHVLQVEQPAVLELFSKWGIQFGLRKRHALVYSHRTLTPYPFQINTAGLPIRLRWHCLRHYFSRDQLATPSNYREWITKSVGKGFADTFLIPYSRKFWTIDPAEMTYEWTPNRVPPTSVWQVLRGAFISRQSPVGANAVFRYPCQGVGYGEMPRQMAQAVDNLHLGFRATQIDVRRKRVEFNNGETVAHYDTMISTIPLPELVRLIDDVPARVSNAVSQLRWNSIFVVNLGVHRPQLSPAHWIHFPEPDISFFRISFPENLSPGMVPPGKSSISAEVAYSRWAPLDQSTIVSRVTSDLRRTGILQANDVIELTDVMDIPYGYVIYDMQRRTAVRTIREWLHSMDIYPTGRYGLWAYLWSHESILAGRNTALRLMGASEYVPDLPVTDEAMEM